MHLAKRAIGAATRLGRSKIGGNFLIYSLDFGLRIIVQLGYFLIIVRFLGPAGYGTFASLTAVSLFASTFVGLGCDQVLIRRIANEQVPFGPAFGNALAAILLTLPPIVGMTLAAVLVLDLHGLGLPAILAIIVADVALNRSISLANACFQAYERAPQQLTINLATSTIKLAATALAWAVSTQTTLDIWAWWYLGSAAASACFALGVVVFFIGPPTAMAFPRHLREGLLYSLEMASLVGVRDLDKPVVVETLGAAQGGYYTAAFRIVDMACIPIRALVYATYTRYFRHSRTGAAETLAFGRKVLPPMLAMSVAVAVGLFVGAPVVPHILGQEYEPAVPIMRALALYPLLLAMSAMSADLLRALSLQRARLAVTLFGALTYVPTVWVGAALMGVQGAAYARTGSQLLIVIANGLILARVLTSAGRTNRP